MRRINHTEIILDNGATAIVDTTEIEPGKYETIVMHLNGEEIAIKTADDEEQARKDFYELRDKHTGAPCAAKHGPPSLKTISGSYSKTRA